MLSDFREMNPVANKITAADAARASCLHITAVARGRCGGAFGINHRALMKNQLRKLPFAALGIAACLSIFGSVRAATPAKGDEVEQRIERVVNGLLADTALANHFAPRASLKERMAFYHTPGVSIAVINNYRVEWARGFGVREWGKADPVTETTLFQAGSISKPVFAVAVMRLVQAGKLDLDEDVNHYLVSWKIPARRGWQPTVTLRQLLSHTAGFTVSGFLGYEANDRLPMLVDVIEGRPPAQTPRIEINMLPGTQFRYSGGGFIVAQQTVEDVVGEPFPRMMHELVFAPLEMKHSTYEQPLPKSWQRLAATSHVWKNQPVSGRWYIHPELAAAGLWTTPSDLARVAVELQLVLKGKTNGILSREKVVEMLTPIKIGGPTGLGFFVWGTGDSGGFNHSGRNEGAEAHMEAFKETGKGAVIMLNSNEGAPLLAEIQRAIAREYQWPGSSLDEQKPSQISEAVLAGYVGEYVSTFGMKFSVTSEKGRLFFGASGQHPVELQAISETKFVVPFLNTEVTFDRTEQGAVKGLSLLQEGARILAERKR